MGHPSRKMEGFVAEGDLNCGGLLALEVSEDVLVILASEEF